MSERTPFPETLNGFTVYVAIGAWSRPRIHFPNRRGVRVCLGFIALHVTATDVEAIIQLAARASEELLAASEPL